MAKITSVKREGGQIVLEVCIDIQNYLDRFGLAYTGLGPAQLRWLKGKIKQEFLARLDEAFPEEGN